MKRLIICFALAIGVLAAEKSSAQVRVNIDIGRPVASEPWYGVDDDYYYMPDYGVYYNVQRRVYVYPDNGRWVYGSSLPSSYGHVTYRRAHHVRIHERSPFDRDDDYRVKYKHDNGKHKGWDKHGKGRGKDDDDHDRGNH